MKEQDGPDAIYVYDGYVYKEATHNTAISAIEIPTKTDYTFKGYKPGDTNILLIDENGKINTAEIIERYNSSNQSASGSYSMIAQWEAKPTKTVTINPGGKTASGTTDTEIDVLNYVTIPTVTYNYNYSGASNTSQKLEVANWSTTSGKFSQSYTDGKLSKLLYTFGNENATITLEFSNATLPTATRNGYKFLGWYTQAEGGTRVGGTGDIYKATNNVTLYAHWEEEKNTINVTGITISPTTASINVKGTTQLTAKVLPENATNKNVKWSSDNDSVATVSATGLVTGNKAGTATITATTEDGSKIARATITVKEANPSEDKTKPVINKVEESNKILYITATDDGGIKSIKVNGTDITNKVTPDGRYYYELEEDGNYVIRIEDNAGNVVEKTVTWRNGKLIDNNAGNDDNSGDNSNNNGNAGNSGNTGNNGNSGNSGNTGNTGNSGSNGSLGSSNGSLGSSSLGSGSSNSGSSSSKSQMQSSSMKDSTMTGNALPKTGNNMYILIGIISAIAFGVFSVIRYKKLKEVK